MLLKEVFVCKVAYFEILFLYFFFRESFWSVFIFFIHENYWLCLGFSLDYLYSGFIFFRFSLEVDRGVGVCLHLLFAWNSLLVFSLSLFKKGLVFISWSVLVLNRFVDFYRSHCSVEPFFGDWVVVEDVERDLVVPIYVDCDAGRELRNRCECLLQRVLFLRFFLKIWIDLIDDVGNLRPDFWRLGNDIYRFKRSSLLWLRTLICLIFKK